MVDIKLPDNGEEIFRIIRCDHTKWESTCFLKDLHSKHICQSTSKTKVVEDYAQIAYKYFEVGKSQGRYTRN